MKGSGKVRRKAPNEARKSMAVEGDGEDAALADMSVDDFMKDSFAESGSDLEEDSPAPKRTKILKKKHSKDNDKKGKPARRTAVDAANHKAALGKLKDIDPEFYDFLKENDKNLLEFDISDEDDDDSDTPKDDDGEESIHKPPESLEVASDESDFEADEAATSHRPKNAVTIAMVREWQERLATDKTVATVAEVTHAFQAALAQVEGDADGARKGKLRVEGGAAFNAVVRLCLLDLLPAVRRLMKVGEGESIVAPTKCKKWPKLKPHIRPYLLALVRLTKSVATPAVRRTLLKHALQLVPLYDVHPRAAKALLKECLRLWGSSEDESVRVASFVVVLRLVRTRPSAFHAPAVKRMYASYVRNSRFTSPSSWPLLTFCCLSLCEVLALDPHAAYQHAFVYIRQLAIHLRNALTLKAKDSLQAVLNWQFVHCLRLWGCLLGAHDYLRPLVYPLTQVIMGTMKLSPTAKYYPLTLHCLGILTKLSRDTDVFIPVLPFALEILHTYKFNRKHTKVSMKPVDMSCMLKASKSQLVENGFKDALVDGLYGTALDYLHSQSHRVGFPELALPAIMQLKTFAKECKISPYATRMKQLADKVRETSEEIDRRRRLSNLSISNQTAVDAWEAQSRLKANPLSEMHTNWRNEMNKKAVRGMVGGGVDMDDYGLPVITKKPTRGAKADKFEGLLPSDDSDEEEISFLPVKKEEEREDGVEEKEEGDQEEESSDTEDDGDDGTQDIVEDFNVTDEED